MSVWLTLSLSLSLELAHTYIQCAYTCIWYSNMKRPLTQKPPESTAHSIFAQHNLNACFSRLVVTNCCCSTSTFFPLFVIYSLFSVQFMKQVQAPPKTNNFIRTKGELSNIQTIIISIFRWNVRIFFHLWKKIRCHELSVHNFSLQKVLLKSVAILSANQNCVFITFRWH